MNAAKIQLSSGHNENEGAPGAPIYHNIKKGWEISAEEQALVTDAGWIFTKNAVIAKVLVLFGELSGMLQQQWKGADWGAGPAGKESATQMEAGGMAVREILETPPRISKGENYKGLPWVVLDYPRAFGREDVFAVRTLFWWGNYFSVTLHLKGVYKELFLPVVRERVEMLAEAGFHIGISDDEWRHELGQENYRPLGGAGGQEEPGSREEYGIPDREFLKFSAKCDLQHWNEAARLLLQLSGIVREALTS